MELLENISEDIRKASIVYDNLCSFYASHRSNLAVTKALDLISIQNNDLYLLLQHYNYNYVNLGNLLYKLVNNKELNEKEEDFLELACNYVKIESNKEIIEDLNNIIRQYKKEILTKENNILSKIYDNTNINVKIYSFIGTKRIGGSAFKDTLTLSVTPYIRSTFYYDKDKKEYKTNKFFKIITHELVHTINKNSTTYKKIEQYIKDSSKYNSHIFSECFTSVMENILNYNYKLSSEKWHIYYFKDPKQHIFERSLEDKIRDLYDKWYITNKEIIFIEYLHNSKEQLINI